MIPLWGAVYGAAWVAWLMGVVGGLGNQKILSLFSDKGGFEPSAEYTEGLNLAINQRVDPVP